MEIPNDGIDQDCDGYDLANWYRDADGDTYGNINDTILASQQPEGYVLDKTDCNDTDPTINPGALELFHDGIDSNCDGYDFISFEKAYSLGGSPRGGDQTADGGYIMLHSYVRSYYYYNSKIVKLGPTGNVQWSKLYITSQYDSQGPIHTTSDGGYIFIIDGWYGVMRSTVIKTNIAGNEEWRRSLGYPEGLRGVGGDVIETSDGNFVMTGSYEVNSGPASTYLAKLNGQTGAIIWEQLIGGANGMNNGSYVQETYDGGLIIVGTYYTSGANERDIYIIKTDAEGNELWNHTYGDVGINAGIIIRQTPDDGFIILGETQGINVEGYIVDIILIKTDFNGNELWSKTFGGDNPIRQDRARALQITADGGYAIFGTTQSYGFGKYDMLLIKTDADGNEEWSNTYGGIEDDNLSTGLQTKDLGFVMFGSTYSFGDSQNAYVVKTDANGDIQRTYYRDQDVDNCGNAAVSLPSYPKPAGYVLDDTDCNDADPAIHPGADELPNDVIDHNCDGIDNPNFEKVYGWIYTDYGKSLKQTADGGYILFGQGGIINATNDFHLVKTDMNGNALWEQTYPGLGIEYASSVELTSDGGYIMIGTTYQYGPYSGSEIFVIKTDASGNEQWSNSYPGTSYYYFGSTGNDVIQTSDGGYLLLGADYALMMAIKIDANGNELTRKIFGYGWTNAYDIEATTDDGYIMVGYGDNAGSWDVMLVKTDADLNVTWRKFFGNPTTTAIGYDVEPTSDNGYVVIANYSGQGNHLIKTDIDGNQLLDVVVGPVSTSSYRSVKQTTDGGYILGGSNNIGSQNWDLNLLKTDASGNELWNVNYGGDSYDHGACVIQASDGGYAILGDACLTAMAVQTFTLSKRMKTETNKKYRSTFT